MAEFLVAILAMSAGVFATSAFAKLRSRAAYRDYRAGLRAMRLVPPGLLTRTAVTLVAVEAVTACGLAAAAGLLAAGASAAAPLSELALAVAAVLTLALAGGVAVALSRGAQATCACFGGSSGRPLGRAHLVRNTFLLALLAAGLVVGLLQRDGPGLADSLLAVAAGLVLALLIIRWEDLVALVDNGPVAPQRRGSQS
jgi:hypothetical protein